jgi:hypothetical protein
MEESVFGLAGMKLDESVVYSESEAGSEVGEAEPAKNSDDEFCIIDDPGLRRSVGD